MALAVASLFQPPRSLARWAFAAGMAIFAGEAFLANWSSGVAVPDRAVFWHGVRYLITSLLPGVWLLFSICYARGNYREILPKWRLMLVVAVGLPLIPALWLKQMVTVAAVQGQPEGYKILVLAGPAKVFNALFVMFSVLVLMNLERTFRAAVGTMRWRIKFVMLGFGLLFAVRIYTSSQALLYSATQTSLEAFNTGALFFACALITVSFLRAGSFNVEIYPSHAILQNSLTALVAGIYLLIVGVLAKLVAVWGGDAAFPLKSFLILVSLVVLTVLLVSDRFRLVTRRFVSRHFQRPFYDYRRVWRSFTERAASQINESTLCREAVNLVSETLELLSATIWLVEESQGKLAYGASTSLPEDRARVLLDSGPDTRRLVEAMRRQSEPINLDESKEAWVEELKRYNPDQFDKGGPHLCIPLIAKDESLGLLCVGDRVSGVPFSVEDVELLKCIGDQVASSLLNIRLSRRLVQAKEMEAFQCMAAFFVHDLKNTASALSLMLQNLPTQFDNPAFRQDALRAVSKSVARLNELITRLGLLREKVELKQVESDMKEVVLAAIEALGPLPNVTVRRLFNPAAKVSMDEGQMQKVVTNLLLNAKEAVGKDGEIAVETGQQNGCAVLAIRDNGCGMSPEFVSKSLFRPFQTTKKTGLGIGMFHCKAIVEAHQGRIEVESEQGKGTTFRVLLPLPGGSE